METSESVNSDNKEQYRTLAYRTKTIIEDPSRNETETNDDNRKIISNENWNDNTRQKKISKDNIFKGKNVRNKQLRISPYEPEMENHDHWIKQYIPINGKKYYYNSCICGIDNIKDERYALHYPEFHTTTTTTMYVFEMAYIINIYFIILYICTFIF